MLDLCGFGCGVSWVWVVGGVVPYNIKDVFFLGSACDGADSRREEVCSRQRSLGSGKIFKNIKK